MRGARSDSIWEQSGVLRWDGLYQGGGGGGLRGKGCSGKGYAHTLSMPASVLPLLGDGAVGKSLASASQVC
jgi:hypothetical protein